MTITEYASTPMMLQWQACKKQAPGAIVLFRLGDFYEAFYEDALLVAKELDITLTKRQDVPMSGVPFHTCEAYIDKLVERGHRVAIAEQMEESVSEGKPGKTLVKREIARIVTPGTLINSTLLSDKTNNFLASVTQVDASFGLALIDLTTADFRVMEFDTIKLLQDELCRLQPKEVLVSETCFKRYASSLQELQSQFRFALNVKEQWRFDHKIALEKLCAHFRVYTLDGFGLKGMVSGINAAGAILAYLKEELGLSVHHLKKIALQSPHSYMALNTTTQRHLELIETAHSSDHTSSLIALLDETHTPMGGRLLKQWVTHPLVALTAIVNRQDAVEALLRAPQTAADLVSHLREIRDLERLIMRIETGFASPRDLVSLRLSLEHVPSIASLLTNVQTPLLTKALGYLSDVSHIATKIKQALVESPPLRISEGGVFNSGYHAELDALYALKTDSTTWLAHYQTTLREQTQIKSLKVGYTKVFGFYIEVSRGQTDKVPDFFQRRQTLVNGERFVTPELKEYEHKILTAEGKSAALEQELFHALRLEVASFADKIKDIASSLAALDCLLSLAHVARMRQYVRPLVDETDILDIQGGRHPIIEALLPTGETFIPNDLYLDADQQRLLLITGPNMAGKSTYIRQCALIVVLAQMGSFVPATRAHIGIIDKLFTRIGAHDDLARGQSTFMVEMTETAYILQSATPRSLVILDEIGRGTSTYDGISIAWSIAEYLLTHRDKRAKTLFATHYCELTALEGKVPGAVNFNSAVHESNGEILFLRKIVKGKADKSYGIHVARLAGLPDSAITRAHEILIHLEKK